MRIIRIFLLLASVAGAIYMFHSLLAEKIQDVDRWIGWSFGLGLVLNFVFLLFCRPISSGNSRFGYLLRLWYNAKLRELRERGGNPPQLG